MLVAALYVLVFRNAVLAVAEMPISTNFEHFWGHAFIKTYNSDIDSHEDNFQVSPKNSPYFMLL